MKEKLNNLNYKIMEAVDGRELNNNKLKEIGCSILK